MNFNIVVDTDRYRTKDAEFVQSCRRTLESEGVLVLAGFVRPAALNVIKTEAIEKKEKAYFCTQQHTVYLTPQDESLPEEHPQNRLVSSSKGCICDDQIDGNSPLRILYEASEFRSFVMAVTGERNLYSYADPLSSINIHYADKGHELGWHFDNSSFATTLLIDKPEAGSRFEYVKNLRDADAGDMNYEGVEAELNGDVSPEVSQMKAGALVLFRGRNSIHRVTPNEADKTRILAVLAYNSEPGIALSESARMTFYGRLN